MDLISRTRLLKEEAGFDFDADIFVGMLTSLIGKQHALITVSRELYLDFVEKMISLIGSNIFGFTTARVVCTPDTTTEEFKDAILIKSESAPGSFSPLPTPLYNEAAESPWNGLRMDAGQETSVLSQQKQREYSNRGHRIPNLVVIRNLDRSSNYVQAQLLEIIRSQRLVTANGTFLTPPSFLVIPILLKNSYRVHLFPYLLDHFFLSHNYEPPNVDPSDVEFGKWSPPISLPREIPRKLFSPKEIENLSKISSNVSINPDIRSYMNDIMVFLRMHRVIRGGISARSSRDFELLVKCLCPVHDIRYATPTIVVIAARKTFCHRIVMASMEDDRSVLYGSDVLAVKKFLQQWTPDLVLDDVLDVVPAPI